MTMLAREWYESHNLNIIASVNKNFIKIERLGKVFLHNTISLTWLHYGVFGEWARVACVANGKLLEIVAESRKVFCFPQRLLQLVSQRFRSLQGVLLH